MNRTTDDSHLTMPAAQAKYPGCTQDRMHLDCVFSIVGDDVCIMMDEMMGESSPTRRLVDEWVRLLAA